jgi:tRNA A37 threonylcarbamoyltransferase TsaD
LHRSVGYGTKGVSSTGYIGDYFIFCEDCLAFKLQSKHVILVGGFAANDYLFERVKAQLMTTGIVLIRPETRV